MRPAAHFANRLLRTRCRAAGTIRRFAVARVTLAHARMRFFAFVLRPCAPIVPQHIAAKERRFFRHPLSAQPAHRAGFIILCFLRARCFRFQVLFFRNLCREIVRQQVAMRPAAHFANRLLRARRCAAGAVRRFGVACVSVTNAGVGFFAFILRPCAPVMSQHIAAKERRFFRRPLSAQPAHRAGFIILCFLRARCFRFQVLLFRNLRRKIVRLKDRLYAHIRRRHGKFVAGDPHIRMVGNPPCKVAVRVGGSRQRNLAARRGRGRRSCGRAVAHRFHRNAILLHGQIVLFVLAVVGRLGVCIVGCEIPFIIHIINIGKRHRIVFVLRRNADFRALCHRAADGKRLAVRQIHVVFRAGNGVVLHYRRAAEVQLAVVAGVNINAAAPARGRVLFDRAARKVAYRAAAVNIHRAAVARGRILGNFAARHV